MTFMYAIHAVGPNRKTKRIGTIPLPVDGDPIEVLIEYNVLKPTARHDARYEVDGNRIYIMDRKHKNAPILILASGSGQLGNPLSKSARRKILSVAKEHEKDSREHKVKELKYYDLGTGAGLREAVALSNPRKGYKFHSKIRPLQVGGAWWVIDLYKDGVLVSTSGKMRYHEAREAAKDTGININPEHGLRSNVALYNKVLLLLSNKSYDRTALYQLDLLRAMNPKKLSQSDEDTLHDLLEQWNANPMSKSSKERGYKWTKEYLTSVTEDFSARSEGDIIRLAYAHMVRNGQNIPRTESAWEDFYEGGASAYNHWLKGKFNGNPLKAGGRFAKFKHRRLEPPSHFDPASFRIKKLHGGKELVIGCPKGHYHPRKHICDVGTRAQAMLTPKNRNPLEWHGGPKSSINTAAGPAYYLRTERENADGRWNDRYAINDGYWVIHDGPEHHVYTTSKREADREAILASKRSFHGNPDDTEAERRRLSAELNAEKASRKALEAEHGQVWDTDELQRDFEVTGFMAPFVVVKRKSDGKVGSLMFQASPRFYFGWTPDTNNNPMRKRSRKLAKGFGKLMSLSPAQRGAFLDRIKASRQASRGPMTYNKLMDMEESGYKNPHSSSPRRGAEGNSGVPHGAVKIGDRVTQVEYYDVGKAKAEGLKNPNLPWRHDYKEKSAKIYGLPDGSVLIKGKKKLWGYR